MLFAINNTMLGKLKHSLLLVIAAVMLVACGGGESTTSNPNLNVTTGVVQGCGSLDPAPATADVNSFCTEFWNKSTLQSNCATCHQQDTAPFFMNQNINQAYAEVNGLIDAENPSQSIIVQQVLGNPSVEGDGHNCWASDQVCADLVQGYIEAWLGESAEFSKEIQLVAPTNSGTPGGGKEFPTDAMTTTGGPGTSFEELIFNPILVPFCATCHTSGPGDPLFADPSNLSSSYQAAQTKINLDDPGNSRLVLKLRNENHQCWDVTDPAFDTGDDCADSANVMENAITLFAQGITTNAIDTSANVVSNAMQIPDGIVASGGARYEANQIALYEFKTGQGNIAYDTSGSEPINLSLVGDVSWVGGWGIKINGSGYAQGGASSSGKLYDLIQATGEYSLEAWVAPNNVTQEMARIINYSGGPGNRNFSLSQTLYNYDFQNRNSLTDLNGEAAVSTPDAAEVLQATLQHVVATYTTTEGRKIYVNGVLQTAPDAQAGGSLNSWSNTFSLVLGNEPAASNDDNLWKGTIKMASIHNRALTPEQINQNFVAGVGEKFFLLFDISHIDGVPAQSYIMFLVSQFDDYSYLFTEPRYISLDPGLSSVSIPIKGMRIGINARESSVGQGYVNIDTTITANEQLLSDIGTTIPLEKGSADDEFFLTFELLGTETRTYTEPVYTARTPADTDPASDIGIKTFDEINETFSSMLGVSKQAALDHANDDYDYDIPATYDLVKQQLPSSPDIKTFVTAHNIGVTQLAMEYCQALVVDATLGDTSTLFGSFDFSQTPTVAFADPSVIIDPVLSAVNGTGMDYQMDDGAFAEGGTVPDATGDTFTTKSELIHLMDNLNACVATTCNTAQQTQLVTKAVCTAAIAGANTLIQ
ncbi:MAG: LamG domain-containing protein [Thioalkalispiraceae bacterium]